MARHEVRALGVVLAVGAGLLGCTASEPAPAPAPATTTVEPTAGSAVVTSSPSPSGPAFDCEAVDDAQQDLDDAYADELDRLDVDTGDPRAQSVYALVTTTQGPAYYAAVLTAAPPELAPDAQLVLDYYRRLSAQVGEVDVPSGSEEDLAAAVTRLDDATLALGPAATGTAVVDAQERLQAEVQRACSGPEATSPTATPTRSSPDP